MRKILLFALFAAMAASAVAQPADSRRAVRISGDVGTVLIPAAAFITTLALKDYRGTGQFVASAATSFGLTYALKYMVGKPRPDGGNHLSFPSAHTSVSFQGAAFLQRRYGWKVGLPAYLLSAYVGWSRVYARRHDTWDVLAGAAIGVGCSYIFTRPFAAKGNLVIAPTVIDNNMGLYASYRF